MIQKPTYEELEKKIRELEKAETERNQMDAMPMTGEKWMMALSEASFEAIFLSEDGVCLDQNRAAEKMFGYTRNEAVGRHGTEWVIPEDRETVKGNMLKGHKDPYEVTGLRKDGTTFPCEIQARRIKTQGRFVRVTALRDITERKRTETALLESEKRYRRIFENLQDVYYEASLDGTILEVSPSIEKYSLYKREELIGESLYNIYTDKNKRDEFIELILEKGTAKDYEVLLNDKDGTQRPCSISVVLMRDIQGFPEKLIGSARDISDRKRAEEKSRTQQERFKIFFSSVNDAIFVHPFKENGFAPFIEVNDIACSRYGYSKEEFMELTAMDITKMPDAGVHASSDHRKRLFDTKHQVFETVHIKKNGEAFPVEINSSIIEQKGRPMILAVVRDISNRRQAEETIKESEERYRQLFDIAPAGIYELDFRIMKLTNVNDAVCEYTGYSKDELLSMNPMDLLTEESQLRFLDRLDRIDKKKAVPKTAEYSARKKDGSEFVLSINARFIYEDDEIVGATVVAQDVTELKQASAALETQNQLLNTLLDNLQVGVFMVSAPSGKPLLVNKRATALLGRGLIDGAEKATLAEVYQAYNNNTDELYPEDQMPIVRGIYGQSCSVDNMVVVQPGGKKLLLEVFGSPVWDKKGNVIASLASFSDITERKRSEEALRESEQKYKSLANNLNVGIYRNSAGAKGRFLEANPAIVKMFGFESREEFLNVNVSDLYRIPDDRAIFNAKLLRKGEIRNEELQLRKKNGSTFTGSISAVVVKDEKGNVKYYDGVIEDITERKMAEEALQKSEERYRGIVEDNTEFIVVWKPNGDRTYANRAYCKYLARTVGDVIGTNVFDDIVEQDRDQLKQTVSSLSPDNPVALTCERKSYKKNQVVWQEWVERGIFDGQGHLAEIQSVGRDITSLKQAEAEKAVVEEKLRQAEKMEAIGTLAGGIAHDFNNILFAILGYSELAIKELPPESAIRNKIKAIHSSGKRARDLVAQILAFSRKDEQARSPVELHLTVKEALKLLRSAIPTSIEIQTQITEKCRIIGDPSQIHQIVMNLCTNAYQAMLKTGGTLNITLSREKLEGEAAARAHIPAGSYGKLVVSDTGIGIPSENIERIFDPYFTTKEKGKGTGLGLAAVHGICISHGGSISVESQIGKGTIFTVYLPLTLDMSDSDKPVDFPLSGGNEHILLVDDEDNVREIEKEMLKIQGYTVTVTGDAQQALALFAQQPERFDLVITDMAMPKMTGDRLAVELTKIRSDIPIILSTGYSELITKEKANSLGIRKLLMKPVTMRDLSNAIRQVLDGKM